MTTYRLPDALGGGEVETVSAPVVVMGTPVRIEGGEVLLVPMSLLEEVEEVVDEPGPGYYLAVEGDSEAPPFVAEHEAGYGWHIAGHSRGFTWQELRAEWPSLTFTELVPDPFAEPVELPWVGVAQKFSSIGPAEVSVELFEQPGLRFMVRITARPFGDGEWRLSWPRAREMARALWAAADAAETAHDLASAR